MLANDTDPQSALDPTTLTIASGPTGPGNKGMGTLSVVNAAGISQIQWIAPDTKGTFNFTYRVCNTYTLCTTTTVTVTLS